MGLLRLPIFSLLGALLPPRRPHTAVDWPDVSLDSLYGGKLPTADYAGRAVLLVNTASRCGFTKQYRALEALWRRRRGDGLVVLGVPSNDFGGQEPASAPEIARFCVSTFSVSFPLAAKQVVSGPNAHPLYKWAAAETGALGTPAWNFHKILIGRDGRIVDWLSPIAGTGAKLEQAVDRALG